MKNKDIKYAGFWVRFVASLLDTIILALPLGILVYLLSDGAWFDFSAYFKQIDAALAGDVKRALANPVRTSFTWEIVFEVLSFVIIILFWKRFKGATPGKSIMKIKIVDAKTLGELSNSAAITRSLGYIVSMFTLMIGFLMVAFRKDKRGLHDLMADTIVIYED